jgi:hypothetical protein
MLQVLRHSGLSPLTATSDLRHGSTVGIGALQCDGKQILPFMHFLEAVYAPFMVRDVWWEPRSIGRRR